MPWKDQLSAELARRAPGGYAPAGPAASEPTALAAVALVAAGGTPAAARCGEWLCELQGRDGSVGVMADHPTPHWPTSLAMLAWQSVDPSAYSEAIARAANWALEARGTVAPHKPHCGHDTLLNGWPWAAGTHSWLEPTAFFVLALKAIGLGEHPRAREGVRLIVDRLLPEGGCNYGNTIVLGQQLLPHVQSTGIALWALGAESVPDDRIAKSLDYLERELHSRTPTSSLCFGLIGLAGHGRHPQGAESWLQAAFQREIERGPSCYKLALVTYASGLSLEATP